MSWSYSGNPASSVRDSLRFLVADTSLVEPFISDEEIDFMIGLWPPVNKSIFWTAAEVAERIAAKFAREVTVAADGVSVATGQLAASFTSLAERLRSEHDQYVASGMTHPDFSNWDPFGAEWDPSTPPLSFQMGMHDNPAAGPDLAAPRQYGFGYYGNYNGTSGDGWW